jgi:hypothetical protein
MNVTHALVGGLGAAALTLSLAAPTGAAVRAYTDPNNPNIRQGDILEVRVTNRNRLIVGVSLQELRRRGNASMSVYVDLNRRRRGPEFALHGPLFDGGDWAVTRQDGWGSQGRRLNCHSDLNLNYRDNRARVVFSPGCLRHDTSRKRVAIKTSVGSGHPSELRHDWSVAFRTFGPWVAYR